MDDRMIELSKIFSSRPDVYKRGIELAVEDNIISANSSTPDKLAEAFINDADDNYGDTSCDAAIILQYIEDRM
jgi:hypothetical protein